MLCQESRATTTLPQRNTPGQDSCLCKRSLARLRRCHWCECFERVGSNHMQTFMLLVCSDATVFKNYTISTKVLSRTGKAENSCTRSHSRHDGNRLGVPHPCSRASRGGFAQAQPLGLSMLEQRKLFCRSSATDVSPRITQMVHEPEPGVELCAATWASTRVRQSQRDAALSSMLRLHVDS